MTLFSHMRRLSAWDSFRPDIALSRDESSRFLPWIIALMVYLAALTLTSSFTLHHTVTAGHSAQAESFSVHIPHANEKNEETAEKVLALIKSAPEVADASIVSLGRIKELLEPWLGKSDALNALPLPVIIEAQLIPGSAMDYGMLKNKISAIAPGAEIDDHKQWISQFSGFVHLVQWVLFSIALLIIMATATVVIFACKTSLKIHRSTINLLHRLGAVDSYIAGQFQYHAALLALKGAFVGSGFAAGTLLALHLMALHINSPLFPSLRLSLLHWVILFSLPLMMSFISLISARFSVLATLHKMP